MMITRGLLIFLLAVPTYLFPWKVTDFHPWQRMAVGLVCFGVGSEIREQITRDECTGKRSIDGMFRTPLKIVGAGLQALGGYLSIDAGVAMIRRSKGHKLGIGA